MFPPGPTRAFSLPNEPVADSAKLPAFPFLGNPNTLPPPPSNSERWYADAVQPHEALLRRWLVERFPSLDDPDDVAQEALTRVWREGPGAGIASPKAFLFTVARNLALDRLRRRQIIPLASLEESDVTFVLADEPGVAESAARRQELEILTQAIQSLPDRCRQVLTLRKIYGLSQREIAARLHISESTVEAQVYQGMRRCTAFLARHGLP